MLTTAQPKEKRPLTFPFIMFPRPFCRKAENPSELSSCKTRPTHTTDARLHFAARDNFPSFDISRRPRWRGASHGINCVEEDLTQRHSDELGQFLFSDRAEPFVTEAEVRIVHLSSSLSGGILHSSDQFVQHITRAETREQSLGVCG